MPRARIDVNGPSIAKEGFDIDTALPSQMAFAPSMVGFRLRQIGDLTAVNTGTLGEREATLTLSPAWAKPPIAFMSLRVSESMSWQQVMYYSVPGISSGGSVWPPHQIRSFIDHVEFTVSESNNTNFNVRYYLFENTLET